MGGPTTVFCILGIAIGVAVICYVLFRKPTASSKLPMSEIVIGDEEEEAEKTAEAKDEGK